MFLTICALTSPRTSVRKSSGRSDQRNPPRATLPPRMCTPSKRVEYTKISNIGFGSGKPGTLNGSNLNDRKLRRLPCASRHQKFVRLVARISARYCRSTRSSDRLSTASSIVSIARCCSAAREPAPAPCAGSKRVMKSATSAAGDVRMRGERAFDECLRQRKADLAHVLGIGAQHDDLVGRHARGDDQPVEVVALDLAAEYAAESVLEHLMQRVDLDLGVGARRDHAEIVYPDGAASLRRHAMRVLVEHLQAHVLQHRQAVGQRHLRAQMENLEPQRAGPGLERPVQRHAERLRSGLSVAIISMSGTAERAAISSR